jgi:peptide/nickel transport system substrate-binding protein
MDEHEIRSLLREVTTGRLSRRAFVRTMVGCGLSVPVASQLLAGAGLAQTSPRPAAAPARRGGGGLLKVLSWDAPNLLNPILAVGLKDWNACAIFYEPLVYFNGAGDIVPVLAAPRAAHRLRGSHSAGALPRPRRHPPRSHVWHSRTIRASSRVGDRR